MTEFNNVLRFFTLAEFEVVGILSELIIPEDEHSPGALVAKVPDYLDLIVSDLPADKQSLWRNGLASLEHVSKLQFGCNLSRTTGTQRCELMSWLEISNETFFVELKNAVAVGFYTSEVGLHLDLRYEGNVFVDHFTGCTHAEHHNG
jgi:hypothetical protein